MTEELLPNIPTLIDALEDALKDFDESDDWSKMPKHQIVTNIYNMYDALRMLATYTLSKAYKIDILDRALSHHTTQEEDGVGEIEDIKMPDNVPKELYM